MGGGRRKPLGAAKRVAEVAEVVEVAEVAEVAEVVEVVYVVAKGKSTTSCKGILDAGTPLKPEFFSGGQVTLDAMIKSGLAVRRED